MTASTTSRGLYVGATRGRDTNQVLVVTDTDDPADARDVLDRVLTFDRADVPATAQRRHLHAAQPPAVQPEPVPAWVPEPAWLADWRHALDAQRVGLVDRCAEHDQRRQRAAAELLALQPALAAARAAWQPYQDRISDLDQRLAHELRPAMYKASSDRHSAGFGHRHRADRAARRTIAAVDDAQAQQQAIRNDGHDARARLDHLTARANALQRRAYRGTETQRAIPRAR